MDRKKLARLEAAGWVAGSVQEFLGLEDAEAAFIELKVCLALAFKRRRTDLNLTQAAAAARLDSSQSRVAKMESAHPTVAVDLIIHSLLKLGANLGDLARVISPTPLIAFPETAPALSSRKALTAQSSARAPFAASQMKTQHFSYPNETNQNITVKGGKLRMSNLKGLPA